MEEFRLSETNEKGIYEIRLESIGGLGANLCTKMLGELGCKYLGLNSTSFSSYGSEKTGTPVKGYVRYCDKDKQILINTPIKNPHLLAIFHSALLSDDAVLEGCDDNTIILINEPAGSEKISVSGKNVYSIDAQNIAIECKSRINVVMLGAIARLIGNIPLKYLEDLCRDTVGKKYPAALQGNLAGLRKGFSEVESIKTKETDEEKSNKKIKHHENANGYKTAAIGGVIPFFGNSIVSDLSASRQGFIPVFIKERCINCGLCDSTCPDMVFQFEAGEYKGKEMMVNKGIDYYHCKGCLRCVEVCPVDALVKEKEDIHFARKHTVMDKELINIPKYYDKTGADGYVTSEAYLTEKRVEGGEL